MDNSVARIDSSTKQSTVDRELLRFGAPGGTRTPGLLVRSQSLYPAELRAPESDDHSNATEQAQRYGTIGFCLGAISAHLTRQALPRAGSSIGRAADS